MLSAITHERRFRVSHETHVVLSWIWNEDGTAAIQCLAYGTEDACNELAERQPKVTSDPREQIVVRSKEAWERGKVARSREFN
jgi:hypothetical protein